MAESPWYANHMTDVRMKVHDVTDAAKAKVKQQAPGWWGFTVYKSLPTGRIYAERALGSPAEAGPIDITEAMNG